MYWLYGQNLLYVLCMCCMAIRWARNSECPLYGLWNNLAKRRIPVSQFSSLVYSTVFCIRLSILRLVHRHSSHIDTAIGCPSDVLC